MLLQEDKKYNIKVLEHKFDVRFEYDPYGWGMGDDALGVCKLREQKIRVNSSAGVDLQRSTFIHELMHVITLISSIEVDERDIDGIALGINSFILNNKSFLKKLYNI